MKREVVFRPEAEHEALEVRQWYEARRPGLGEEFSAEVEAAVGRIAEDPLAYQRVRGETRRAVLTRFPYALYFRITNSVIVRELLIHAGDPRFEDADLLQQEPYQVPDWIRQHDRRIFDEGGNPGERRSRTQPDRQAVFAQQAPHRINASRAVGLPVAPDSMKDLQRLLFEGLHGDGAKIAAPRSFQQCLGVGAVGLIAPHVRSDVLCKAPHEVLKRYEKWKDIAQLSGPQGIRLIKGFHDEALAGKWRGYRSSRLGDQWRVIYRIAADHLTYYVESMTPHDYRRQ